MQRPLSPLRFALRITLLVLLALFIGAVGAMAQLVTPKTVPVLQDEQFNITPSSRPGLGSPFIALTDTLADPFVNPAKLSRLRGASVAVTPYIHEISGRRGGGSTLPVALYIGGADWSVAALAAYQSLNRAGPVLNRPTSERSSNNQYVSALAARRIGTVSVGASISHAGLGAVDGVDLLYAGSDGIEQNGSVNEYKLGLHREWAPGHSFELLGIHNRTSMTHDVHFTTWRWDPVAKTTVMTTRQDHNEDETHIWGVHSKYYKPVGTSGWRVGGLLTANRLAHPKIPNYVLQNIPRDPGTTFGYNIGVGAARVVGASSFYVDLILEPLTSETWADMERDTTDVGGAVIPAGAKTIENSFDFHNSTGRVGIGHIFPVSADSSQTVSVDAGFAVHTIGYGLRQTNNITRQTRGQAERWAEITQSIGVRFRTRDFEVSYSWRHTCGTQACDEGETVPVVFNAPLASAGGIIAAPGAPLFLQTGIETTHRFLVAIPIR